MICNSYTKVAAPTKAKYLCEFNINDSLLIDMEWKLLRYVAVSDCAENGTLFSAENETQPKLPTPVSAENEKGPKLAYLQFRRRKRKRNSVGL